MSISTDIPKMEGDLKTLQNAFAQFITDMTNMKRDVDSLKIITKNLQEENTILRNTITKLKLEHKMTNWQVDGDQALHDYMYSIKDEDTTETKLTPQEIAKGVSNIQSQRVNRTQMQIPI